MSSLSSNLLPTWISSICLIVAVFISDDTFLFGTNTNKAYIIVKYVIYVSLIVCLLVFKIRGTFKLNYSAFIVVLLLGLTLLTALYKFDITGGYVYQIMVLLLAYLMSTSISENFFISLFSKLIYLLSIAGILAFIVDSINPAVFDFFPIFTNSFDFEFYHLGVVMVFKDVAEVRNTGIFREPGMFMIYINIAIIIQLFYAKEINVKYLLVYLVSLFLTFSTAAFIVLFVIFLAFMFRKNRSTVLKYKLMIIGIGLLISIVVISTPGIYDQIFAKIGKDNINEGSSLARGASVLVNFFIFANNWLLGTGITQFELDFASYSKLHFGVEFELGHNTNTITTILAIYGVFFGIIFLYLIFKLSRKFSKSFVISFLLFIALLMMYSNEDLRFSVFSFFILFWGLQKEKYQNANSITI